MADGDSPNDKVVPPGKKDKGLGKNKFKILGGMAVVAVLVFFFVSRSKSSAAASGTSGANTSLDPATQAALQSALQGQGYGTGGSGNTSGSTGGTGPTGPPGPPGKTGPPGKPPPDNDPRPRPKPPPDRDPTGRPGNTSFYTVRPGDTLSGISSRFNIHGGWQSLYNLNRTTVGANPNVIHPGQRLHL